jgi:hypothetical protein
MDDVRRTHLLGVLRVSNLVAMSLLCIGLSPRLCAQAAAEAASTTAVTQTVAHGSPHILTGSTAAGVEANRQALEAKAGKDGSRLLIRSIPSQAQVWINEKPVGNTPLLLIVPPGKYKIELRGARQENAQQEIAVLPRETREVTVKLELRYPTRVTSH